jgi:hypothetical protein
VEAPGYGNARFVLDPDVEPTADDTTLSLLIMEMNCASGEPPIGREIRPVVTSDDTSVSIVVLVEPVEGGADCPSNPWYPVEVELDEPLGDRAVFDASVVPALERPWPPTASSQSSLGLEE